MTDLTLKDVARLVEEPSPAVRAETAAKVAGRLDSGDLDPAAREIAEQILRLMIHDAEVRVRAALAETLKASPNVPHDVVLALAQDDAPVAEPVLRESLLLSDDELIAIVRERETACRVAVARRAVVSPLVCDALIATGEERVVATVAENPGAEITPEGYHTILADFAESEVVKDRLARREGLPIGVAERLVSMVSEHLREHLVLHYEVAPEIADEIILDSRERATLGLLEPGVERVEVDALVAQLHAKGRLTPTIVLRAVCTGDLSFFESAMARLAGIPVANAYLLIHDQGPLGLREIYHRSGMPVALFPLIRTAVTAAADLAYAGDDREHLRAMVIERLLTQFEDGVSGLGGDDLDYLLARIGGHRAAVSQTRH